MRRAAALLYALVALPFAAVGLAVLIAGWVLCTCLAITPLVVPAVVAFRAALGGISRFDAMLAEAILGERGTRPAVRSAGPPGYWRSARNVLTDEAFWKQQVYVLERSVLGAAFAVVEIMLLAGGTFAAAQPLLYRLTDPSIGSWQVDSLGRAALFVLPGAVAALAGLWLIGPFDAAARSARRGLLGATPAAPAPIAASADARARWLAGHAAAVAGLAAVTTLIWLLTTRAYFWPAWPILVFAVPLAIHAWVELVERRPAVARRQRLTRGIAIHEGVTVALAGFLAIVWALAGFGYVWPVWPILVLLVILAAHAGVVLGPALRRGELEQRVASLETSRAGVVDQQEAELRRIERDLHDGAQARLVALGMSLGMAEQKLASDPAAARELLGDARRGAHEALAELRDLARGIHPPVLVDRGLEAAVAALASRTPLHVRVMADLDRRPPTPVESAAYFVISEALANAGKHARAEHVDVVVRARSGSLLVEVVDDGIGGADRTGSGLTGLARRVEALDGGLEVTSPRGGPTTVRAVLPCGS